LDGPIIEPFPPCSNDLLKPNSISRKIILLVFCWVACLTGFSQNLSFSVPVVFHIISNNPSIITDQQIQDAVQDLNNAFAHGGNYAVGSGANTGIRFCLARVDPEGGISTGITRTQSVLGDFDSDIENDGLKKLVSWNTKAYCNIWLVDSIKNEYFTSFSCGNWSRRHNKNYASFLPDGDYRDGIVTNEFGSDLAMQMGNYLGLNFTFVLGSCANTNCNTDGDGVCDTPPASGPGSSCTGYQNSCSSDTLSGFAKDMPDLNSNFMSFSGPCTNSFTEGQAAKMRSTLAGARSNLFAQNKCDPPCTENITASFTRNNWLPAAGDLIQFNGLSTGGTNYQWTLNDQPIGVNSLNYSQSFTQQGRYKVTLKVFNSNQSCFASYSDSVIVGCGVMARFYPDKRIIASKDQILNDSILFTNRSVNAGSYQWWISNNTGMSPQIISYAFNLNQSFASPGQYSIWLVASNGGCSDTTEKFNLTVYDPTIDATIGFGDVECYEQTKIKVNFEVCNLGYAPMPVGTPVTFYDGDPATDTAKRLDSAYLLPSAIQGNCCGAFNTILDIGMIGLNRIYAVVNDNGNTLPLKLPNTSVPELSFNNNIAVVSNFQFKVKINPPSATLVPGDTLQLSASASPGTISSYLWSDSQGFNCTGCASPVFIAGKDDVTKKLIVTSDYNCIDSDFIIIKVPVADDYTINIDSMICASNDHVFGAFTIYNQFKRGIVPNGLKISFYEGSPSTDTARLLQQVYTLKTNNRENHISFTDFFEGVTTGSFFAVVNDNSLPAPINLPADSLFPEKEYSNNTGSFFYLPFSVSVYPSDTTVSRGMQVPLHFEVSEGQPVSFNWNPSESLSCSNCSEPIATPAHSQQYVLEVQNEYACKAKAFAQINTITGGKVSIPNAFTPNGDGRNDVFYVMGSQDIKIIKSFSIFNRWGMAVFSENNVPANDPGFGWNGLNNGRPLTAESYVYVVIIEFKDGSQQVYRGSVVLIL
jgi:gliding motility-associated-like protein